MHHTLFSRLSALGLTAATLTTMALTGCGFGAPATSVVTVASIPAMTGKVMGGETPVYNSVVTLWETDPGNTGYGLTARQIETATVIGGSFTFATGYTCTHATDFLYVTSTGGDVTGGSATPMYNPNLVLIAALGSCVNFATPTPQGAVTININELSTVAAAYALGNFMTVSANGGVGTQKVYIGAPSTNNATTGSCTGTGSSMTCTAAGLAHAFANAINLVNAFSSSGAPTGQAYTTLPTNSSASVPQALIDTLGNIVQYCTNSGNTTSSSSTISTNCTTFFNDSYPTNATPPTDTLSALINIAHFPQHNIGTTCTGPSGGLFCLATSFPAFSPALTAVPHDWTIGIAFAGDSQGSFDIPQYVALDANDNVYIQTGNLNTATQTGMAAMTSSGSATWYLALSTFQCSQGVIAPDTNGNVFMSWYASSTGACPWGIWGVSAANGAVNVQFGPGSGTVCNTTTPNSTNCPGFSGYDTVHPIQSTPTGIAVDRYNNLWYNRRSSTCNNCMLELPYSGSGVVYGAATTTEGFTSADWDGAYQMVIDSSGNVYSSSLLSNIFVTPNNTPAGTPTYTSSTTSANQGYLSVPAGGATFGLAALDSAGNLWTAYANEYVELTPSYTSSVITGYSAASGSPFGTAGSKPQVGEFDGHDNLFAPSYSTSGLIYMQTSPSYANYGATNINAYTIQPCYAPAGANACSATLSTSDPHVLQIDSTGSMWVAGQGASSGSVPGFIVQIIGTAYPAWPQISYGVFGVTP